MTRYVMPSLKCHRFTLLKQKNIDAELYRWGEDPKRVISTGAIGVHNIVSLQPIPKQELEKSLEFHFTSNTILCTLHAATLDVLTPAEQMQNFC